MKKLLLLKSLFLLCALIVGTSAWATDQTIEITFSDVTQTGYSASEVTFIKGGFTFGYINAMKNGSNGTPSGWASNQVIQTKSGGSIYNKTAITGLKNIRVYIVANTNSFTITSGTSAQPTTNSVERPSTATGTQSITYSSYTSKGKVVTPGQTTTASYYDFAVSNDYFQIAPGGSLYIWKIVLTYDEGDTKIDPTLSFPQASYDVDLGDEFVAPTLSRDLDGTGAVTYSSSNTNVATVNSTTGAVTVKSVGSTTITANVAADDKYKAGTAQYVLNVNFQVTDGVFDFEKAGAQTTLEDYGSGVTLTSSSNEYVTDSKTWTAVNVTMETSGKYRWWNADKTLRFYDTSYMEFSVPDGYVITKIDHTAGTLSEPNSGSMSGTSWVGASQSVKLQASGNFKSVTVTYTTATQSVTVGTSKYAAYCSSYALDFTSTEVKAYKAKVEGGKVKLTQVNQVPANTGVILHGNAGDYNVPVIASASAVSDNELIGVNTRTLVEWETGDDGKYNYILQGGVFKKAATGGHLKANRAYLHTSYDVTTAGAREYLEFAFEDEVTGVADVRCKMADGRNDFYNLNGQKVLNPTKGLYIVNGKKVVIK